MRLALLWISLLLLSMPRFSRGDDLASFSAAAPRALLGLTDRLARLAPPLSCSARVAPREDSSLAICRSFESTICARSPEAERRLAALSSQIQGAATTRAKKLSSGHGKLSSGEEWFYRQRAVEDATFEELRKRGVDLPSALIDGQSSLIHAVRRVRRTSGAPAPEMLAQSLAAIRIVRATDWVLQKSSRLSAAQKIAIVNQNCREDGLQAGAYFSPQDQIFFICPGWLAATFARDPDPAVFSKSLAWVIGHEMGHAIDHDSRPKIYTPIAECLHPADSTWSEVSADATASGALAMRLVDSGTDPAEAARVVLAATAPLCGTSATDDHLSGSLRLLQASRDGALRQAIGCGIDAATPDCSLLADP